MLLCGLLLAAISFADTKTLAVQICLDREGYSCNTIDGVWGPKGEAALAAFIRNHEPAGFTAASRIPAPEEAYDLWFADRKRLFRYDTVTREDFAALVKIPTDPAAKAELSRMGYESIKEMFAERGHVSQRALERLNPGIVWERISVGTKIRIPDFPSIDEDLSVWPKAPGDAKRPEAAEIQISLSRFEISVIGGDGKTIALFPCSIAQNKAKLPPTGELKVTTCLARPNYTYTPDFTPAGAKPRRHVWPEGENSPIGVAWIGLNLSGYGIHGTVRPETIGNAESHGCFRLSNWNAARLYALTKPGTRVIVKP